MCYPTLLYGPILFVILRYVPPYSVIFHSSVIWNSGVLIVMYRRCIWKHRSFEVWIHKIKWTSCTFKWFFWAYVYMPSQLIIPCLLQACACFVPHLAVNIIQIVETVPVFEDFTTKSLFLFVVVGIWHTYPTGFILVYSMIQRWDVMLDMCKYCYRNIILPADI